MAFLAKQKSNLRNQFEQLNLLYQFPRLYLHKYFNDMKTRIDITFVKKERILIDDQLKEELNNNWFDMLQKVNQFEQDCLRKLTMKFDPETNRNIQLISDRIRNNESNQDLYDLINDQIANIERVLFLNKTILFFEKLNQEETAIFGTLIIITNENLNSLLFKERLFETSTLTQEMIKSKEIIKKSSKEKSIIETTLDTKRIMEIEYPANDLSSLGSQLFTSLTSLVSINLSDNQIERLDDDIFKDLINLNHVDLSGNQLKVVQVNIFKGLLNLKE